MRRLLLPPLLLLAILAAVSISSTAVTPLQAHAAAVRAAVPAAEAYYAGNGTYAGMTVAKLRRTDTAIRGVVVAEREEGRLLHPELARAVRPLHESKGCDACGRVRRQGCRDPYVSAPTSTTPVQASAASVRSAIPAIEAYYSDRGFYTGMTLAKLRKIDPAVGGILIRSAPLRCASDVLHPEPAPAGCPLRRAGRSDEDGRLGVNGAVVS